MSTRFLCKTSASVVLLAVACAGRAQAQTTDLWPMQNGTRWVLQTVAVNQGNNRSKTGEQVVTVISSKHGKAGTLSVLSYLSNGKVSYMECYLTTAEGVFRTGVGKDGNTQISPVLPLIKYPATPGKKWKWSGATLLKAGKLDMSQDSEVVGIEKVRTPAGTYNAVHVRALVNTFLSGKIQSFLTNDFWFASGVGMVQQKATIGQFKVTAMLSKYTPGK
jgi:hypothetical protein